MDIITFKKKKKHLKKYLRIFYSLRYNLCSMNTEKKTFFNNHYR